eukprot:g4279.t1
MRSFSKSVPLTFPLDEVLIEVIVDLDWRDQGWGNQKGGVRIELRRDSGSGGSASTIAEKWLEFAPHKRKSESFAFVHHGRDAPSWVAHNYTADPLVTDAETGDYYRLGARVGEYPHKLFLHSVGLRVTYGTLPSSRQLGEL